MKAPFFSIGISAYKPEHLLECLNSVLFQTFQDFEIIILNDCSPYNLESIIKKIDTKKISYFRGDTNAGAVNLVNNWNFCLSKARGDFFLILGDDDVLEKEFLQIFYDTIIANSDIEIFHCRSKIINESSEIVGFTSSLPFRESVYDNIWHRIKGYRQQFISDFIFKSKSLKHMGGFYFLPAAWGSDDITSFQMINGRGIIHINEPLLKYRINSASISYSGGYELDKIEAINLKYNWLSSFVTTVPSNNHDFVLRLNIISLLSDYTKNQISSEIDKIIKGKQLKVLIKLLVDKEKIYNVKYNFVIILFLKYFLFNIKKLYKKLSFLSFI